MACVLLSTMLITVYSPTYAQSTAEDIQQSLEFQDQFIIDQQNRERIERERRERLQQDQFIPTIDRSVPTFPEKQGGDLPSFNIQEILLDGADMLDDAHKASIISPYIGTSMTIDDINQLIRELTNYYVERGFITTRVYIPKQQLSEGTLTLAVIEGRVTRIDYNGHDGHVWSAFGDMSGKVLNLRDIEQGLDQMNRLRSNRASMRLIPDEATVGGSVVMIENQPIERGDSTLSYDTLISDSLSLNPNAFSFSYDNMLELNDHLSLNYYQRFTDQHEFNNNFSLGYSIPWTYFTLSLSYGKLNYSTLVNGTNRNFITSGSNESVGVGLSYVLFRNQTMKTNMTVGIASAKTLSFIEDTKSDTGSRHLANYYVSLSQSIQQLFGNWSASVTLERGVDWFGADRDDDHADPSDPKAQYGKGRMNLRWYDTVVVGDYPFSLSSSLSGTLSYDTMYSAQRITIGNYSTVRGFQRNYQGDRGWYIRNDVSYPLTALTAWAMPREWTDGTAVYMGVDAGMVVKTGGRSENGPEGKVALSGAAIGIRTQFFEKFNVSVGIGIPIWASSFVEKDHPLYFSASLSLF